MKIYKFLFVIVFKIQAGIHGIKVRPSVCPYICLSSTIFCNKKIEKTIVILTKTFIAFVPYIPTYIIYGYLVTQFVENL